MKLVNSPQFDTSQFKQGEAVRIEKCLCFTPLEERIKGKERFAGLGPSIDALVLEMRHTEIAVLVYTKTVILISIDDVTSGYIDIIKLKKSNETKSVETNNEVELPNPPELDFRQRI